MYGRGTIVLSENRENTLWPNRPAESKATHDSIHKLVLALVLCNLPPLMETRNDRGNQKHQSGNVRVVRDFTEDLGCGEDGGDHLR